MGDFEEDWDNEDAGAAPQRISVPHGNETRNSHWDSSRVSHNATEGGRDYNRENHGDDRRARGGGGGRTGGSARSYNFSECIDIQSDCIGRIIGRGGSNIQRVQNDYNVRVDVDKGSGSVTVSGNEDESVKSAIKHIQGQMDSSESRGGGAGRFTGGGSSDMGKNYSQGYSSTYDRGGQMNFSESSGGAGRSARGGSSATGRNYSQGYESNFNTGSNNYQRNENNDFYNPPAEVADEVSTTGTIDWDSLNKRAVVEREKRWAKCPPLTKNFYQEMAEVANLLPEEVERIRAENNSTSVSRVFEQEGVANDIPNPVWKFEHCFAGYPDLLAEIYKQEFVKPSPIQAQAWPILLKGEDLIGIAQTGTGKTLAFLLPGMIHTEYQTTPRSERGGPNVLVMAPTRELALQIEKEVNKYSFRGMKAVCVYGGGNRRDQISSVQCGAEIIICTPGRLNDLIQANVIDVASITYLVLDEADRMLDMGFEPQIRKILLDIRPDRQTVMTSATWPPGVRRLAQSYMNNPIQVCVGSLDLAATHTVEQIIEIVDEGDKFFMIKRFIKEMRPDDKIIIFLGKKTRADDLSSDLTLEGIMCQCIHGSRDQADREQAIADITSGEVRILIATDVASRGLDIEDVTHVINFDFPRNIEEYVHRVGRTGRAGRRGTSISYLTRSDWGLAHELIDILKEADQYVPEELLDMSQRFKSMKDRRSNEMSKFGNNPRGGHRGGGGGGRDYRGGGGGGRDRRDRY